jgi:16S rRNA (cytidine1402-2'-O)-methyltransferase
LNVPGQLFIVATPIGNLSDISQRAKDTLKEVDLIAAEDTRHSAHLLQHLNINTPLTSLHEHNEEERSAYLIDQMQQGKNIALISDAGTPLISDPGYRLLQAAHQAMIKIVPIPGPCALIAALSVSGLPADKFIFEGFLPAKTGARTQRLQTLQTETRTLIFYEAPHRILATLDDMISVFGEMREAVFARELTKTFETLLSGSLAELKKQLLDDSNQQKGEFVILIHGAESREKQEIDPDALRILKILLAELPVKQAATLAAKITGARKNQLYELALNLSAPQK